MAHEFQGILMLPEDSKLKGEENYSTWKQLILTMAAATGLEDFLNPMAKDPKPKRVDVFAIPPPDPEDVKKWKEWSAKNAQAKLLITLNCKSGVGELTVGDADALDVWENLRQSYEEPGSAGPAGPARLYEAMKKFHKVQASYNSYPSLNAFIQAFQIRYERIAEIDPNSAIPETMLIFGFITAVDAAFPHWAGRQRCLFRKNHLTLTSLIEDLKNEEKKQNETQKNKKKAETAEKPEENMKMETIEAQETIEALEEKNRKSRENQIGQMISGLLAPSNTISEKKTEWSNRPPTRLERENQKVKNEGETENMGSKETKRRNRRQKSAKQQNEVKGESQE